jgi:CheY-like chemotaxis protein
MHAEEEHVQKEALLNGRRILFMEDDGIIRLSVTRQLKGLKYEIENAKDGNEAIKLYKKASESGNPFDAVIMDLTIPGSMGGEEAIKELLKIDPDVKAIIASGYSNDPIMTNFSEYGFKGVVEKPFEIYELDEALQKVIKEK